MRAIPVLFLLALSLGLAQADDWSKRFAVSGKPDLRVESNDSAVILRAGPAGAIDARLTTRGWRIGPGGVRVDARQTGSNVVIDIRVPNDYLGVGDSSCRLEVTVPAELRAEIRTGDGSISAESLKGDFVLNTGDGAIDVQSLDGALAARTGYGRLNVRGRFDRLSLRTNDGSITAVFNSGSKMAGPWRLETGDGSITVRLAEDFAADIDARTGDGGISIGVPATATGFKAKENAFRGRLGGGGLPLRIRTGDGSIRLERL
ncbi:MAG: DUF4097 family beta strand repeat-containing protein [Acidobacteriota bacterium]